MNKDVGQPLLGALLRVPLRVIERRIVEGLNENGHPDIVPAHLGLIRYPGPDGKRPVDLATEANMTKQAMNYLLGELERLGYLERRPDPDDVRFKRVYMTERGADLAKVVRATVRKVEQEWARDFGAEDLEQLRSLLLRLQPVVSAGR